MVTVYAPLDRMGVSDAVALLPHGGKGLVTVFALLDRIGVWCGGRSAPL